MAKWYRTPRNQGQMVAREWAAAGEAGAILRMTDHSDPKDPAIYYLHRWLLDGVFEPWNGSVGVWKRGRRITEAEAERLLDPD